MNELSTQQRAFFYSQYSFIRQPEAIGEEWLADIYKAHSQGELNSFQDTTSVVIYFKKLDWDSNFFGIPFLKVVFIDVPQAMEFQSVQKAFANFRDYICQTFSEHYIFIEVPCEDTGVIAGISGSGWRLIETRLTYYNDGIQNFSYPKRSSVRTASEGDIEELRKTAAQSINHYDRFHADDFFAKEESDNFMSTFIENSVRGFADEVLIPAEGLANAFLTGNYLSPPRCLHHKKMAKMVFSAVSTERKGWYVKLISELSYRFKEQGIETIFMTTQATNRTVVKTWSRIGYQYGKCTHIFSTYNRKKSVRLGSV